MAWVEAKTMFGMAPPDVTGLFSPPPHDEATEPGGLVFEDDVTAPYVAFDMDPTQVDHSPLHGREG